MDMATDFHASLAALAWQADLGADEAIGEAPVNRYETVVPEAPAPKVAAAAAVAESVPAPVPLVQDAAVMAAKAAAGRAETLEALRDALALYDHCELKKGAKSLVFADGNPAARVLVLGEAPGREEDQEGRPFVGRAGQLLDRMFAAIGMDRTSPDPARALYITNVMPWRPPQNRDPEPDEIAMMLPFVERHIALVAPDVIVAMGNTPCAALLGRKGITRMRGEWAAAFGKPVLPMFHPAYLLRQPHLKRDAWADLLALQARLRELP